ncbi:uncharacterized protein LOC100897809 [Galendromus occidentalis]|uniref:Uncharacterized protein LOC100897809 n=1 Tax=Galendromus occidentalis TaxID=34638 RepID=A0AAJ6QMW5_9ACAR|nr:uncharacterized protein LOC100897809 [Galendromus occidentalis]
MDKLSQRTSSGQQTKSTRTRRDTLPVPAGEKTAIEELGSYESFGDLTRNRQKRYSYHAVGALALLALASSPYLWGGPWGFGGPWAYRYPGYPGYYPGYVPVAGAPAAAAAKK